MKIEKYEMVSQERNLERKLSRGSSSSGKRNRDSQIEYVHGSTTRGKRQGPTMRSGSDRGTSTGQKERPECPQCHKHHFCTCRCIIEGCFRFGSTYHLIVNCSRGSGSFRNPQRSSRGGSNVPQPNHDRGRG